ncbi:rho guanine nucleotide exchange factor TIAM2 isoform X1 [Paramormyrops kingsleyae]|uniref:rho guanine nucleotide exchange factor TIAM2 isoform X1 n=2 Tax=Paramormyrops kingsleyae TaxID=1676925 RepID=UPI003B96BCD7
MGNSESQYSIQGPKGGSLILTGKRKPSSLKFCSSKEEALSPQTWWRGGIGGSGYKSRAAGRGWLSQHKGGQPYVSRHYDYVAKGGKVGGASKQQACSPERSGCGLLMPSENGYCCVNGAQPEGNGFKAASRARNGHTVNGCRPSPASISSTGSGENSSPKVLIKKDGSLRVEFTNNSKLTLDDSTGPVQLLKFCPTVESTPSHCSRVTGVEEFPEALLSGDQADPASRASKSSSLSSEGSWYDAPWGNGVELGEMDTVCSSGVGRSSSTPPVSFSELYRDPSMGGTLPAAEHSPVPFLVLPGTGHRASFTDVLDVPVKEGYLGAKQYSSYTLPCRKARPSPSPEGSAKKDSLKSRMRNFSDWTGSLSRKKRKVQEPRNKEAVECFDSGVDGLTADTSSPSQGSSLLWYPGAAQPPPARSESASALHGNGTLRQNIYENFMRELETGGGGVEQGASTETEDTSSDSLGSLEQLDQLLEKEQGVVRRAGWLSFKPLVTLHKDRKLELVTRRKWRQYWVTLKGCTLLFYETYSKSTAEQDLSPRYALFAEDSVVQSVPEHPKKENVFCLSNSYGDVYLFQASSQTDLENWVTAVHSACASLFARRHGKEDTVRLLRSQTRGLLQKIDMDGKMKKMAELQLSIVSDPRNRKAIESQIQQWEQNLEKFNMDLFRMRCYLASLQGGELPNPKSLLATASRPSKMALGRLGIFSVSSFHALICSRDEASMRKRSLSASQKMRSKRGLFSSLKGLDNLTKRGREKRPSVSQIFDSNAGGQLSLFPPSSSERLDGLANLYSVEPLEGHHWDSSPETLTYVYMPDNQAIAVPIKRDHTVKDVLALACKVQQLEASLHGLRVRGGAAQEAEFAVPGSSELLADLVYDALEIFPLSVFTVRLSRPSSTVDFGFAVTGHVDGYGSSRIFVSEVLPDGMAVNEGLRQGDEILVLNGKSIAALDLGLMQEFFCEQSLSLSIRRDAAPEEAGSAWADLESREPCPPVPIPNQMQLLEQFLDRHRSTQTSSDVSVVPDVPGSSVGPDMEIRPGRRSPWMEQHDAGVEAVCTLYQTFQEGSEGLMDTHKDPTGDDPGPMRPYPRHMPATERLRKVIQELVDTEKSYVKDLSCLFEIYLKPLQNETFLTQDEMESLFGSLPEMLDFQKVFLQTLEERIASSPDFNTLETPVEFKKLLFSLGAPFLYYADHFKLYSGFCANHIKVQKVLERAKTDRAFKEFLDARNPTKQHSSTLESYLIKPVQRVLKYPLLLRELVSLTDTDSEEHHHLTEALKAMEKVASHINEMQKIYEDYGTVFDQLVVEQSGTEKEVTEISMGEFLMHSTVMWLNPFPSLGRMRKEPELTVFVFKKAVILVYRENNKLKKKMTAGRSSYSHGDLDPFKFRWLIPLSALQVRLGNTAGTEKNCIWELIHTKSELEGRPETVFQLCSSVPECMASIVKVIRSVLRENVRRNREGLIPLRKTVPASARIGSSRASWLCKQPSLEVPAHLSTSKAGHPDSDEGSLSSRTHLIEGQAERKGQAPRNQRRGPQQRPSPDGSVKESDILSDDEDLGETTRSVSPASAIEAQFRRLKMVEQTACGELAPYVQPEGGDVDTPEKQSRLLRSHPCIKRKNNSLRRNKGALLSMKQQSRSLDSQEEPPSMDLNTLLEREFSVQSLTSVVNEDCFYNMESTDSGPVPTL